MTPGIRLFHIIRHESSNRKVSISRCKQTVESNSQSQHFCRFSPVYARWTGIVIVNVDPSPGELT